MTATTSRLAGFYRLPVGKRTETIAERPELGNAGRAHVGGGGGLPLSLADRMSENVIGTHALPLSVALNFLVNGRDHLIPMAVEEPSVVAAASHAAKLIRETGGFKAGADKSIMTAEIQFDGVANVGPTITRIHNAKSTLLAVGDEAIPGIVKRGGGCRDLEVRSLGEDSGFLVIHIYIDVVDAMGANIVDSVAEAVAPTLAEWVDGRLGLRILSNLPLRRMAWAEAEVQADVELGRGIALASKFAELDPMRAVTHNKGVMNGIDSVALAIGQDWRAIEAGAHAFAAYSGQYRPLATWRYEDGLLRGRIELPMAVGTVGGAVGIHPGARTALELLAPDNAPHLAAIMTAVGLASNLAALRALAGEGIQRGHMRLHNRRLEVGEGAC